MLINSEIKQVFVDTFGEKVDAKNGLIKSDLWNIKYSELGTGNIYAEITLNISYHSYKNHNIFRGTISSLNLDVKGAFINNFNFVNKLNDFNKESEEEKHRLWEEFAQGMEVFSMKEEPVYKNHFSVESNDFRWIVIKGEDFLLFKKTSLSEGEIYFYNELPLLEKEIKKLQKRKQMGKFYV